MSSEIIRPMVNALSATASSIVVLTGAGISAESGIRTFRAADGLWEDHRVEDVATPEAFLRDPDLVHRFYNERRQHVQSDAVAPNPAHVALAEFEQRFDGDFLLVTQNIDDLHERAGSRNVLHMHGELLKQRCKVTGLLSDATGDTSTASTCSCCNISGNIRPHVVWFGEMPLYMDDIYDALARCDLFISIGTSGNVYPAAGFVQVANQAGARTVELNLEPSITRSSFTEAVHGSASSVVPQFLASLSHPSSKSFG
ncbi:MAG: Sir2 family NAD+-dependent deacetylase [bacterium]